MPLSDAKLRALKAGAKPYKVSDSQGLHVLVAVSGSRLWRLAYRFAGKQKLLALGRYPDVSLADARLAVAAARKLLDQGVDPAVEKKAAKRKRRIAEAHTFASVANDWFAANQPAWVDSYSERIRRRLDNDLISELGSRPIASIEPIEVLDAVRRVEDRGALVMAQRILQMAGSVFRFGVATSRCPRDPTADLRGALKSTGDAKHRAALKADDLPGFYKAIDAYDGEPVTALALELAALTFVRSAELRFATFTEIGDLDAKQPLWRIPAERMKMRRDHLVPLSPQAVAVFKKLRRLTNSDLVFAAKTKSGVISENTMLYALYRMGYHSRATVHGFRSTASTILNEQGWNRDWIEMQLAHVEGTVRSVYNAAEWLPGRREMMIWWADFLDRAKQRAEIDDLLG